jgi:CubicO group peptidase (beta-lactamase class C family)
MRDTAWDAKDVDAARLAHGHRRQGDGWTREVPLAHGAFGAMGGLYTSIDDLSKYVAFMLSAWPPRDVDDIGPVRRSSLREMQTGQRHTGLTVSHAPTDGKLSVSTRAYGYGLGATEDCLFSHVVSHGGGLPGYGSTMQWLPEHGVGVIVFANVTYAGAGLVGRRILEMLHDTGALQPRAWPASEPLRDARERITTLLNEWMTGCSRSPPTTCCSTPRSTSGATSLRSCARGQAGAAPLARSWPRTGCGGNSISSASDARSE